MDSKIRSHAFLVCSSFVSGDERFIRFHLVKNNLEWMQPDNNVRWMIVSRESVCGLLGICALYILYSSVACPLMSTWDETGQLPDKQQIITETFPY